MAVKLVLLISVFTCMSFSASFAASGANEALYGYLTKFKGEVFASSNWYVNASVLSEKIGTVLLEDIPDSQFELEGNKLMITLKRDGVRIEVGTIDESVIAGLQEGERALVQTMNSVKFRLVAQKSRPSFTLGWGCGITGCAFAPHAEIKRKYLLELFLPDGQIMCVNHEYDSSLSKLSHGKCSK